MDSENHNDCNQREIQNNTVEAMDTEEGKFQKNNFSEKERKKQFVPIRKCGNKSYYVPVKVTRWKKSNLIIVSLESDILE